MMTETAKNLIGIELGKASWEALGIAPRTSGFLT